MKKPHPTDTTGNFIWDVHCPYCITGSVHPIKEYGEEPPTELIFKVVHKRKGFINKLKK
jgi:hypothetical protein